MAGRLQQQRVRQLHHRGSQQQIYSARVASDSVDVVVREHDYSRDDRQCRRHLDRPQTQAHAHRDELLPGEPEHSRHHGLDPQRHIQLRVHAQQPLALWRALLQGQSVHRRNHYLRQRVHSRGHLHRQVSLIYITVCVCKCTLRWLY